jgi:colanic acid biosynthesis glycosyl transferase WcaI
MAFGKTRLVFVNRYFYPDESATSQLLADLLFDLAGRGYDVHVICSRQLYGNADADLSAEETVRNIQVHRVQTTRFGRRRLLGRTLDYLSFYATCTAAMLYRLRRGDIVIAMTDPPLVSVVAAVAAWLKGATLINWLQDVFPEVATQLGASPLPASLDGILRRLRDASLRSARVNVVLGSRMSEYLRARGIDAAKIQVIENWADAQAVQPKAVSDSILRHQLRLEDQFVAGYSGNLGRAHEIETLLAAVEALQGEMSLSFLFIGGGFNMDALKRQVSERRLSGVRFLPYQPRESLTDSLAAADVHLEGLIVPSKFYGILAAGRPVVFIGDPDGELARVTVSAHCGRAVSTGDGAGLARTLLSLKNDAVQRQAMGRAARQLLSDRYSTSRAIDSWVALLDRAVGPVAG